MRLNEIPDVQDDSDNSDDYESVDSFVNDDYGRIRSILNYIFIPELLRSLPLRLDLALLKSAISEISAAKHSPLHRIHDTEAAAFASHIMTATEKRPHLIVVYAWVLYTSLLNGGRRIRTKLLAAGPAFWDLGPGTVDGSSVPRCLSFWFFADNPFADNEIRDKFKQRLLAASSLLTAAERQEIVTEAVAIFKWSSRIVAELDVQVSQIRTQKRNRNRQRQGANVSMIRHITPFISSRIRALSLTIATMLPDAVPFGVALFGVCASMWALRPGPAGRMLMWQGIGDRDYDRTNWICSI